ncbi:MAG: DUF47 family protein [Clostridia bacterium]|nr:DUF47 family protein [Clostridia bacterium]
MLIFNNKNPKVAKCFADHHEDVVGCLEKFEEFIKASFAATPDKDKMSSLKTAVDNCENAADGELRHDVDLMSESFLPATRSSLISIVQSTDEVANICQEVTRQIMLEKIALPASLHDDVLEIISITKAQLAILYVAIEKLFNDYKSIFNDRKILDDIRSEESKVDSIEAMLHTRVFELDLSLCEKIYYRDLIEDICDLSDTIEDIADQIQIMLIEREA